MTMEEAISLLERVAHTESKWPGTEDTLEALDMAISALRQQDHFREVTKKIEPMTNADRIRAMTNEELAEHMINAEYCHEAPCKDGETCRICCLKWLQQPAGEEDKHEAD